MQLLIYFVMHRIKRNIIIILYIYKYWKYQFMHSQHLKHFTTVCIRSVTKFSNLFYIVKHNMTLLGIGRPKNMIFVFRMASLATNTAYILHPLQIQECVREWLKEDTPTFDFGGCVVGEHQETAILLCKSPGVLSGCPFFDAVFREVGCTVEWLEEEGVFLEPVKEVAIVKGKARHLLLGERIALNIITRASGVASIARRLHDISKESRWQGEVSGTRKLTPGFRLVEKYSLLVGGISTHRMDLSSMIMLKDNHIWTAGDIKKVFKFNFYSMNLRNLTISIICIMYNLTISICIMCNLYLIYSVPCLDMECMHKLKIYYIKTKPFFTKPF